jgi:chromosomal replication initiation ATPase DnaA
METQTLQNEHVTKSSKSQKTLLQSVCTAFDIKEEELLRKVTLRANVSPRQCYIALLNIKFGHGPSAIGRSIPCNHATVNYSLKKFLNYVETEKEYRCKTASVLAEIKEGVVTDPIKEDDLKRFPDSEILKTLKSIFGDLI